MVELAKQYNEHNLQAKKLGFNPLTWSQFLDKEQRKCSHDTSGGTNQMDTPHSQLLLEVWLYRMVQVKEILNGP